jgi:hypothetical protein
LCKSLTLIFDQLFIKIGDAPYGICTNRTQTFGCALKEDPAIYVKLFICFLSLCIFKSFAPYDGYLGLGFSSLNSKLRSPLDQVFNDKVNCLQPVYSIWLDPNNEFAEGELVLCDYDTDHYEVRIF